ncbi:MAG: hypothetical protein PF508_17975, partial [Spirochaeta sp.]|nr:hypothetical protein [Spirochaeta sp.]
MKKKASNRTDDAGRRGATNPRARTISAHDAEPASTDHAAAPPSSSTDTAHPHDRLFKEVFSTVEAQQDLVRMALPEELTSRFRI